MPPFIIRAAINSAAAADNELAIDCGVLLREAFQIAGVLRRHVARMRLAVADRRPAAQSRVLCQMKGRPRRRIRLTISPFPPSAQ